MSQENVEIVRRVYDEDWLSHPARLTPLMDPSIEWVNPPDAVEPGVRQGLAAVAKAFTNVSTGFESTRYEVHDLFDGDDTVVASVSFFSKTRGSDFEIHQLEAHTWTFRAGSLIRFEWGRDLDRSLEAAGLRE
jgi:ketosteroid isomerase-like protein